MPPQPAVPRVVTPLATFMKAANGDRSKLLDQAEYIAATTAIAGWAAGCQRELGVRRIGIAAMDGGGDSGFAAVGIARAIVAGGKRAVVIDAARQASAIESLCGVPPGPGLVDLLSGAADFTKVFGRDSRSTLHVLRYGSDRSERAFGLVLQRLDQVLSALGPLYDMIIVDAGNSHDKGIDILCKCEAAVLLAPVHHLTEAVEATQALEAHGLKAGRYALVA
jgi:MinD-like ATPase involved in chromosome partitioning or flagellar assembly